MRSIGIRTYEMVEAYLDRDKKTVKRAEIHDQWHLRRTVALRENLPRHTRAPRLTENGRFADLTRFFQFDDNTAGLSRKPSAWASEVAKRLMAENK